MMAPSRPDTPEGLIAIPARDLLHGCVALSTGAGGWVRPARFTPEQTRAVGSCLAWHPGLLRQMARTTSGITIEFETDASEVSLEVMVDSEPQGTAAVLERIDGDERKPHDGISADVDGRHVGPRMPDEENSLTFTLDDVHDPASHGMLRLPGFGSLHHVRIWLPALRGCAIRTLIANGTYVHPVPERPHLLVFGDSVAQGFVTEDPATSWPALLADRLGLDLVNQGLGGQVFQPGTLYGLAHVVNPQAIAVAFGENYRYEHCLARPVARDVRNYLMEVSRIWGEVPTYVLTPLFHDEGLSPSHAMSCWQRVPSMISANAAVHDQMALADGLTLMDHDVSLLADADGHPNALGARQVAVRMHASMLIHAGTQEERQQRALSILEDSSTPRALPFAEGARRGIGEFVVADQGCVLWRVGEVRYAIIAPDLELGRAVVDMMGDAEVVGVYEPGLVDYVRTCRHLDVCDPFHLAIYESDDPLPEAQGRDIRVLDESSVDELVSLWPKFDEAYRDLLKESLGCGDFLGGFEGDKLVGFVGEYAEGSIGPLVVSEGHRRQGWARALESAKVNQTLERDQRPWGEVLPHDRTSLALQRSLSFAITPAAEQCFLSEA